jgi:ribosomal protein S14
VYRKFGLCRIHFRELADKGLIPGLRQGELVREEQEI